LGLEEVKQRFVGSIGDAIVLEVEKGAIKRFAEAVDDPNPLYRDEEYARRTKYGSIIAPPGFFGWPVKPGPMLDRMRRELAAAMVEAGYPALLDGGIEFEFMVPVRPGDILVAVPKIANIYDRETRAGKLAFGIIETSYTNQNGALVAVARQTLIWRTIPTA